MKAENVKKFMLKKYPTKDYFDCPVPKHHWEVIQEYAEQYARIQIEKDRVSESELMVIVKSESKNYHPSERTCFLEGAETVLRQLRYRPINLES